MAGQGWDEQTTLAKTCNQEGENCRNWQHLTSASSRTNHDDLSSHKVWAVFCATSRLMDQSDPRGHHLLPKMANRISSLTSSGNTCRCSKSTCTRFYTEFRVAWPNLTKPPPCCLPIHPAPCNTGTGSNSGKNREQSIHFGTALQALNYQSS